MASAPSTPARAMFHRSGRLAKRHRPLYRPGPPQDQALRGQARSQISGANSARSGADRLEADQRSKLVPNHASQTIARSCATTARRGWMTAMSLRIGVMSAFALERYGATANGARRQTRPRPPTI